MKRTLLTALAMVLGLLGVALGVDPGYAQVPEAAPYAIPGIENRDIVWVAAQMHILFAAFILGAPIFVVISEWIGMRKKDPRYDRLAKEVTKVTAILYSMTALTGGLFILVLVGLYPNLTSYLVSHFFPIFA
ncbi:MAG: cytochrome ubiquinol oxidase subunit I, partial [Nitrospirae bacterium]|nr:cytochrome ubiquinol oxidase subunit I [Nitrospirota bacterium]